MKKIDKSIADAYFRARNTIIIICLIIGMGIPFGSILFAEALSSFTILGAPAHYYIGSQGAVIVFIVLLWVNAIVSDSIDKKFGIDEETSARIGAGKVVDH